VSDPRQDALQRELANDEAKCANCGRWLPFNGEAFGYCERILVAVAEIDDPDDGDILTKVTEAEIGMSVTLDLDRCSKWEPKP